MRKDLLERLSDESGYVLSDFHDPEKFRVMYEFLKKLPDEAYPLQELIDVVSYAFNEDELAFESKEELLNYVQKRI